MGSLETPGRDDHPDRPAEIAAPTEVSKETAGQNVERTSTEGLAAAISQDYKSDPAEIDFEAYDPKHPRGTLVVIGETDSKDNPKRLAYEGKGVNVFEVPPTDEPILDDPSGQDLAGDLGVDRKSKYERLGHEAKRPEFIEGAKDIGTEYVQSAWDALKPPEPTGAYTRMPDRPVASQTPSGSTDLGALATVPLLLWIGFDKTRDFVRDQIAEWKQSRGDFANAHN